VALLRISDCVGAGTDGGGCAKSTKIQQVAADTSSLPGMLGGMFVGMARGMVARVASVTLYRAFFALRNRNPAEEA
jgi:hypothetical protein